MTFGIILGLAIIMFIVGYVGFQIHWTIGMLVIGVYLILAFVGFGHIKLKDE